MNPPVANPESPRESLVVRSVESPSNGPINLREELADGFFDLLSSGDSGVFAVLAALTLYLLWWLFAPAVRAVFDWFSGWSGS